MSFEFHGRVINTDDEGYLLNKDEWDEELMAYMASKEGLSLSADHMLIIKTVRQYFDEYATTPAMRNLIQLLKKQGHTEIASSVKLARLFPDGAAKTAARLAGLPKPVKCI